MVNTLISGFWCLAVPAAPDLVVANPDRLAVPLFDARCAVTKTRRQPGLPKIGRQLAQVHVIVTGDQSIAHERLLTRHSPAWR